MHCVYMDVHCTCTWYSTGYAYSTLYHCTVLPLYMVPYIHGYGWLHNMSISGTAHDTSHPWYTQHHHIVSWYWMSVMHDVVTTCISSDVVLLSLRVINDQIVLIIQSDRIVLRVIFDHIHSWCTPTVCHHHTPLRVHVVISWSGTMWYPVSTLPTLYYAQPVHG